ncbi:alpha/beta fold hydrolase [Nonomuraea sp. SYSU D8015]|uniref:alpha/beta fold hydrolase n=1 Tax=Nonomuraea sp. SYSU D8015 TaxID=2593644 RepID=UPI00166075D5|nr:alpha/beta fold hydrolase [Nonomuraea sp. SYSU D8015]
MSPPGDLHGVHLSVGKHRLFIRYGGCSDEPAQPPIVLIHGLVLSSRVLLPTMRHLARRHFVIAPDLPGCGASPHPASPMTIEELADTLGQLLHRIGRPCVVLANSFGSLIAVEAAIRHSPWIHRLVIAGPSLPPVRFGLPEIALRWVGTAVREPLSIAPLALSELWYTGLDQAAAHVKMSRRYPLRSRLHAVRAPTLVIRGTRDLLAPRQWSADIATATPAGQLIEVKAAHALPYEIPELLTRMIESG